MEYGKRNELKNVYTYGNERISTETIVDASGNLGDGSASASNGASGNPLDSAPGSASANRSAKALESASGSLGDGSASASNGASGSSDSDAPGSLGGGASGILPNPDDIIPSAGDDDYKTDYYLYDGRGSVSQVVNGNEIIESYNYDPFGNVTSGAPDFDSFYGYNAEETNPVTGLQYLRARYYDTEDGRFSVADTYLGDVSQPLTLNRYAYTANNPVMNIDPSGHIFGWVKDAVSKAVDVVKSVGSAIGNGIKAAYNHLVDAAQERADNKKGQNGNYSYSSRSSSGSGGGSTTSSKNQYGNSNRSNAQSYTKQQMEIIKERYVKPFCDGSMEKIKSQSYRDLKGGSGVELIPSIKTNEISDNVKELQLKAISENAFAEFNYNAAESFLGVMTFGQYYKGLDKEMPYFDEIHSGAGAKIGSIVGSGTGYAIYYGLGGPVLGKVGQAVGGGVKGAIASSVAGDLTIGVAQSVGMADAMGLEGADAAKYIGTNLAIDLTVGIGMEGISGAFKSINPSSGTVRPASLADQSGSKATGTYGDLVSSGQKDAHHIIQDAAVRDIPGYNRMDAPAIQLDGPSNVVGTEHYYATITQRRSGGGTYGAERGIAYMSLRKAGLSVDDAKAVVRGADDYFMGQLGLTLDSPTRIPGNRRQ